MGEGKRHMADHGPCLAAASYDEKDAKHDGQFITIMDDQDDTDGSVSSALDSASSDGSSFSSEFVDDASSSSASLSPSMASNGPLFELSELMAQLPIKRGISQYYQGKSQSFTSLSMVRSIEDLAKKETPYRRKMKACKSYGGGLDSTHKSLTQPKPVISKKASRGSLLSSSFVSKRSSSFAGTCCRPPPSPEQKNFGSVNHSNCMCVCKGRKLRIQDICINILSTL